MLLVVKENGAENVNNTHHFFLFMSNCAEGTWGEIGKIMSTVSALTLSFGGDVCFKAASFMWYFFPVTIMPAITGVISWLAYCM